MDKIDGQNLSCINLEMIIPIRCMNCGNVLADKWLAYQKRLKEESNGKPVQPFYMDGKSIPETPEGKALDNLGLKRYCCRKHMLTHVDLMDKI